MKLLLVSDSHGYEMQRILPTMMEGMDVFPVILGRGIAPIRGLYRELLQEVYYFDPELILMHMGHNDVTTHRVHNTNPLFVTAVFHMLREFAQEITANFPEARLIISSMLPRTAGSYFSDAEALSYNKIAKRYGQMLLQEARSDEETATRFVPSLNRNVWGRISKSEAKASLFDNGGLHLTNDGKEV
jgi:hypothetical protein